jgi:ribonuclease P protein component
LGFTIGKRFGTAVERNRMRRRLRHCVNEAMTLGPVGTSHVLMGASRPALTVPYRELVGHCRSIIEREPNR